MRRLFYSLRLVMRSLRRDPVYSAVMMVTLTLSVSLFVTALTAFRRIALMQQVEQRYPGVYRVQPGASSLAPFYADNSEYANIVRFAALFLAAPTARTLAATGIPPAASTSFLAQLAAGLPGQTPVLRPVRFCHADLLRLFSMPFAHGGPWRDRPDLAGGSTPSRDVVVLNAVTNDELFGGGDSVGRHVVVQGRALRVVGVLAPAPPATRDLWNFNPLPAHGLLLVPAALADDFRPEPVPLIPPVRPGNWDQLAASASRFVEVWVSLPDADTRRRYQQAVAAVDAGLVVVAADEQNPFFNQIPPAYTLFLGFTTAVLLANVLNVVRLLLAKGMARSAEIGIHRALGATRDAIFARQLIEGVLVVLAGSATGVVLAVPTVALFDRLVPDLPTPLTLDPSTALLSTLVCVLLSLLAGIYPAWRAASVPPTRYLGRI
ncbi:MAG: FtsX-like permease family protein [Pseudomonadota bacterium]